MVNVQAVSNGFLHVELWQSLSDTMLPLGTCDFKPENTKRAKNNFEANNPNHTQWFEKACFYFANTVNICVAGGESVSALLCFALPCLSSQHCRPRFSQCLQREYTNLRKNNYNSEIYTKSIREKRAFLRPPNMFVLLSCKARK